MTVDPNRSDKEGSQALFERWRLVARATSDAVWDWSPATDSVWWSDGVEALLGYRPDEVGPGLAWWRDGLHPDDRVRLVARIQAITEGAADSWSEEYRFRRKDGSYAEILDRGVVLRDGQGRWQRLIGAMQDIARRKESERTLRESEERFRELAESIDEVFWTVEVRDGRIPYVSPAYELVWGRSCESLCRQPGSWLEAVHPEDRDRIGAMQPGRLEAPCSEEYRIVRPDGGERWIRGRAFPIRAADGAVRRIVNVAQDITERKRIEQQFLRTQRLEAVGTLATGIAHDLNNILTPMLMVASLLREEEVGAREQELLQMIEQSAERGAGIIRQLLTFSRGAESDRGLVQVRHLVKEVVTMMRETFPRQLQIVQECPSDLGLVHGNATELHQVLMNLAVNARDAMAGGGVLRMTADTVTIDAAGARVHPAAAPGRYIVLSVVDTGHGIPPDVLQRIFDPFFSTKAPGKGTGLGLFTVEGIVRAHGGFLTVESTPGQGSAFRVHLPCVEGDMIPSGRPSQPGEARGRGETVLLVEDEESIRNVTRELLTSSGYVVLAAGDGQEGLELFERERRAVDLIVTDLMMPNQGGLAMLQAARRLEPGVRMVAMTGMLDDSALEQLKALGVAQIVEKPFAPRTLLTVVRDALAARAPA